MKYIITETQLETIKDKILKIPFSAFDNDWDLLQEYLKRKRNPPYILNGDVDLRNNGEITTLGSLISVEGDLDLSESEIQSLGNLTSVGGNLNLYETPIESLGNLKSVGGHLDLKHSEIQSLGNLTSIGGDLSLYKTPIKSLGNLTYVGGSLGLYGTPFLKKYSESEIRDMIEVSGNVYL
jgi:hypothetical protein